MRSLFIGLVITAVASIWPTWAVADSNDAATIARRIAGNLKNSGQMESYHIGVKFTDGTAWLLGSVASSDQEETAMAIAETTPGVDHVVSKLSIDSAATRPSHTGELPISPAKLSGDTSETLVRPVRFIGEDSNVAPPAISIDVAAPRSISPPVRERKSTLALLTQGRRSGGAEAQEIWPVSNNSRRNAPLPYATMAGAMQASNGPPRPAHVPAAGGVAPARYDQPNMPGYAWPSYAAYPNYAGLTYPRQYSPTAWPYIGPFYPYPQVPLGWRKVSLEWDDGWWQLDFKR